MIFPDNDDADDDDQLINSERFDFSVDLTHKNFG